MNTTIAVPAARRGLILVVLAGVLWGTSGVTARALYGLVDVSPITVAAFRLALGAPVLLAVMRLSMGKERFQFARSELALMLLVGAALGTSQACYFAAVSRVGVAIATLVTICTGPVLVCLFSAAFLHERLTPAIGGALVCALLGTVLLVGVEQGQGNTGMPASATLAGILLALAAAAFFATFILASRLLARRYDPLQSIAIAVTVGAVLLLAVTIVTTGVRVTYPPAAWALFLYLGLIPTALAYALFFQGVKHTTASEASIAALAEPLTSTALALAIYGERLGPLGLLGAALLISVIVFLYRNG